MPRIKGENIPQITVKRPHLTVRYTRSQLEGIGALDTRMIFHQLTKHFGFDATKPIKVRRTFDSKYYEQELDEPVDQPMFG